MAKRRQVCVPRELTASERKFVSSKVRKLRKEGYGQKQAVAIAYRYLEDRKGSNCFNVQGRTVCFVCY